MTITFHPAMDDDATDLAPRLRPADRAELAALSNRSPLASLRLSLAVSDQPMAVRRGRRLIALYGVGRASLMSDTGMPWLLASDELDRIPRALLAISPSVVGQWRQHYPRLANHVSVHHHRSIRWLKWLGFTLHKAEPFGAFGHPFHPFEMRSPHV